MTDWTIKEDAKPQYQSIDCSSVSQNKQLPHPGHLTDHTTSYVAFFDAFAARNNFTGRSRTTGDEVKQLTGLHSRRGNHLFNAMLAVGAMYAGKLNANHGPGKRETLMIAFQHYSYSIEALREAIDAISLSAGRQLPTSQEQHVCILWTTFLLGLFEVGIS